MSNNQELRACRGCFLIKTYDLFLESGCENCAFAQMKNDHDRLVQGTTPNFTGIVPVFEDPKTAPRVRIGGSCVLGYYALALSEDLQNDREEENVGARRKRVRLA